MEPIMLESNRSGRTERVCSYVEPGLMTMLEDYRIKAGDTSISVALRRLTIIGAEVEGYQFVHPTDKKAVGQ